MSASINTTIAGGGAGGSWGTITGDVTTQSDLTAYVTSVVGVAGYILTFSTTTTDADPGQGVIRFNNATQSSTTLLYVDTADKNNNDLSTFWKFLGEGSVLSFRQSSAKWQEFIVQGIVAAAGYYKISVVWKAGGTALTNTTDTFMTPSIVAPYSGTITGDITALTRNADGTVATITINGLIWTQAYNSNGTLNTETSGGLVRTYNYDANGKFTGVSGAIEVNGSIQSTFSVVKALVPSKRTRMFATDLGDYGVEMEYQVGAGWGPLGGKQLLFHSNVAATRNSDNSTDTTSQYFISKTIPGTLLASNGGLDVYWGANHTSGGQNCSTAVQYGGQGASSPSIIGTTTGARGFWWLRNSNATGTHTSSASVGATYSAGAEPKTFTVDSTTNQVLRIEQHWAANNTGAVYTLNFWEIWWTGRGD